ncbi:MAG: amino acid transporter [Geodermatophilaceae bacterium]|nr:amino acid transporter [Geodermatophilaceae bacterium]
MSVTSALPALATGLGLGLSLIVAIGAQNAFVLRQGLRGEHVGPVVTICVVSDAVLIVAGVGGAGALLIRLPGLTTWVRLAGAAFLLGYGLLAARRALRPAVLQLDPGGTRTGLLAASATCLALTWLNPHVYLDTVVLLGTYASAWEERRWWFALGAVIGSTVWFVALGYGGRLLRPVFARPGAWRVLDAVIAVVMIALAVLLAVEA